MNIDLIIEEELSSAFIEARKRIKGRIASMLLGGDDSPPPRDRAPAPTRRAPPAGVLPLGSVSGRTTLAIENDRKLFEFVRENPGCYGQEIARGCGLTPKDSYYSNGMARLRNGGLLLCRGAGKNGVWEVTQQEWDPSRRSKFRQEHVPKRGHELASPERRREQTYEWFKNNPGSTFREFKKANGIEQHHAKSFQNTMSVMKADGLFKTKGSHINLAYTVAKAYQPGTPRAHRPEHINATERDNMIVIFVGKNPGAKIGAIKEHVHQNGSVVNSALLRLVRDKRIKKKTDKDGARVFHP